MKRIILCLGMSLILNHIICFVILNNTSETIKIDYFRPDHRHNFVKSNGTLSLLSPLDEFIVSEINHNLKRTFGTASIRVDLRKYSKEQLNDLSTIFVVQKKKQDNFFTIGCNVKKEEEIAEKILKRAEEAKEILEDETESKSKLLRFRRRLLLGGAFLGATGLMIKIVMQKGKS